MLSDEQIEELNIQTISKWNAGADSHNQWDSLGDDERRELFARAIEAAARREALEESAKMCESRTCTVSMFATSREATTHNRAVTGDAAAIRALIDQPAPSESHTISVDDLAAHIGFTDADMADARQWAKGCDNKANYFVEATYMVSDALPVATVKDSLTTGAGDALPDHCADIEFSELFAAWWEDHGQFVRSGGGKYERFFAFEAWRYLYPQLISARAALAQSADAARLNEIADEYYTLEPFSSPTGGRDDADVCWRVLQWHCGERTPRIVAVVYKDDPRAAIDAAMQGKQEGE
ncbi:hypothetical protein [Chitinilyticum aquatile]|uniref:hypothetical protein n=1 Tax=Chitinilyticum aquatile TaxID=362520 RepID=UPI0003F5C372|nr:hypothetical protein [Chitinilyticum aquatile]